MIDLHKTFRILMDSIDRTGGFTRNRYMYHRMKWTHIHAFSTLNAPFIIYLRFPIHKDYRLFGTIRKTRPGETAPA
jgi:hypothetical protein